ncbi:hypothetical protein CDCA_CDCA01G0289 [Cyanidium caldarium]|uniref:Monopolin complex subunit Csm1/Pcs1 C-terminal domain-containing protein n=1 Tax=Cyanidium caldarium TaxID=2771 RepID=A0AAV9IPT5_CYACA|nr:hypothetical protein CDCA_CDCA01G0289 [Cyanidium caldarium]
MEEVENRSAAPDAVERTHKRAGGAVTLERSGVSRTGAPSESLREIQAQGKDAVVAEVSGKAPAVLTGSPLLAGLFQDTSENRSAPALGSETDRVRGLSAEAAATELPGEAIAEPRQGNGTDGATASAPPGDTHHSVTSKSAHPSGTTVAASASSEAQRREHDEMTEDESDADEQTAARPEESGVHPRRRSRTSGVSGATDELRPPHRELSIDAATHKRTRSRSRREPETADSSGTHPLKFNAEASLPQKLRRKRNATTAAEADSHATRLRRGRGAPELPNPTNTAALPTALPSASTSRPATAPDDAASPVSAHRCPADASLPAAMTAFEEYRQAVAAQLDASERLVEHYKLENQRLLDTIQKTRVSQLQTRIEDLERDFAAERMAALEARNRALELEAQLIHKNADLEQRQLRLHELENRAVPAAEVFQLCCRDTSVKRVRVQYEPEGDGDDAPAAAVVLDGYEVLIENTADGRRARFQLVPDSHAEIEYNPLEVRFGEHPAAPSFLYESIFFAQSELPLFLVRLLGALFER